MTPGQNAVYSVLKQHGPLPDHALVPLTQHVAEIRMSSSGIRSRRAELVDSNLVEEVDTVRMPSGRLASVWNVV